MRSVTDSGCSVYSLFSALIMHVYQMRSSNQSIVVATQQRLTTCMNALKDVSKVWLVAKMVHTLFESILGNKVLEERLQKAAGRKHQKNKHGASSSASRKASKDPSVLEAGNESSKRKFDDMEFGFNGGPPAPQMSYERSRPQSPAASPRAEAASATQAPQQQLPHITAGSPTIRQGTDAFMGNSRANTRPTTPFNNFSYPGTPPDLFLHTRNSPKISEDLWQNYQPDQLFPPETNTLFPLNTLHHPSPNQMVDPALRQPPPPPPPPQQQQQQQFAPNMTPTQMQPPNQQQIPMADGQPVPPMTYHQDPAAWNQMHSMGNQSRPDDQWSNSASSTGGPIVPTTLNVGDWFEFFGIPNGADLSSGLNGAGGFG